MVSAALVMRVCSRWAAIASSPGNSLSCVSASKTVTMAAGLTTAFCESAMRTMVATASCTIVALPAAHPVSMTVSSVSITRIQFRSLSMLRATNSSKQAEVSSVNAGFPCFCRPLKRSRVASTMKSDESGGDSVTSDTSDRNAIRHVVLSHSSSVSPGSSPSTESKMGNSTPLKMRRHSGSENAWPCVDNTRNKASTAELRTSMCGCDVMRASPMRMGNHRPMCSGESVKPSSMENEADAVDEDGPPPSSSPPPPAAPSSWSVGHLTFPSDNCCAHRSSDESAFNPISLNRLLLPKAARQ
mmetsp:Transcript_14016/g.44132  ORF Transcript_14016/g.44132 Transcript_14016/m.44132 type:complete len:300 (+) Transcript_14016:307-1206(+)